MEDLNALRQTLHERLLECYENRKAFWEQLDTLDLIAYAEEIYASQVILENLPDAFGKLVRTGGGAHEKTAGQRRQERLQRHAFGLCPCRPGLSPSAETGPGSFRHQLWF